jgi:hypothetical protein
MRILTVDSSIFFLLWQAYNNKESTMKVVAVVSFALIGSDKASAFLPKGSASSLNFQITSRLHSGIERRIPKGRYDDIRARPVDIKINKTHYRTDDDSSPQGPTGRGRIDDIRAPLKKKPPIKTQPISYEAPSFRHPQADFPTETKDRSSFHDASAVFDNKQWWNKDQRHHPYNQQKTQNYGGSERPWYEL